MDSAFRAEINRNVFLNLEHIHLLGFNSSSNSGLISVIGSRLKIASIVATGFMCPRLSHSVLYDLLLQPSSGTRYLELVEFRIDE